MANKVCWAVAGRRPARAPAEMGHDGQVIQAYSVEQIRAVEAIALERDGDETLMRRASYAVAVVVAERVPSPHPGRQVALLVGSGNNGGDALFAGAFLRRSGVQVVGGFYDRS